MYLCTMFLHVSVYDVFTCICVCIYMHLCMMYLHVSMYLFTCTCVCIYMNLCMYLHVFVYVLTCIYVFINMYLCTYLHVFTRMLRAGTEGGTGRTPPSFPMNIKLYRNPLFSTLCSFALCEYKVI